MRINFSRLGGTPVSAYVNILNALNNRNVNAVYPGSGTVDDDGWLETPAGRIWAAANPERLPFYRAALAHPNRFGPARSIQFGLTWNL